MKTQSLSFLVAVLLLVGARSHLHAQLVADGNSILFTEKTNIIGNLTVGTNGGNTSLTIYAIPSIANGAVTNVDGNIGLNASSTSNQVAVQNTGAVWVNTGNLFVGNSGSSNQLMVTDGGLVTDANSYVGYNSTSSNNQAIVSGSGSVWSTSLSLGVGSSGSYNQLLVTDGGRVEDYAGALASRGNTAIVAGANSIWDNNNSLYIGYSGPFNQVLVTNSGTLDDLGVLYVGFNGPSNQMTVTTGGKVDSATFVFGSFSASSIANVVVISDPGSELTTTFGLYEGDYTDLNQMFVTNGAKVIARGGACVGCASGRSNLLVIAGAGSSWTNGSGSGVGNGGSFNQLIVSNGAAMWDYGSSDGLGGTAGANNNIMLVTGTNSLFWNRTTYGQLVVGLHGSFNQLLVRDGGTVETQNGFIGQFVEGTNNVAVVADPGSIWINGVALNVGLSGSFNQLVVSNAGTVTASGLYVGASPGSSNNAVTLSDGSLFVTNSGSGVTDVRSGTLTLNDGSLLTDQLLLTSGEQSQFTFNSGTVQTRSSTVNNGSAFAVGDGTSPATFELLSNGTNSFANGLRIANHATLKGNGIIVGNVTNKSGSVLSPGASVGELIFSNSPVLQGTIIMEISKSGAIRTNDQIRVTAPLTYGGSLVVSNLGPTALAAGDRFQLFSGSSYGGAFSGLSLPNPGPGLNWTNKLLVDGSIEVVTNAGPKLGKTTVSRTNLIFGVSEGFPDGAYDLLTSTNITTPLTNWSVLSSGNFDWLGNITLTNGIGRAVPKRFFTIRVP